VGQGGLVDLAALLEAGDLDAFAGSQRFVAPYISPDGTHGQVVLFVFGGDGFQQEIGGEAQGSPVVAGFHVRMVALQKDQVGEVLLAGQTAAIPEAAVQVLLHLAIETSPGPRVATVQVALDHIANQVVGEDTFRAFQ